MTQENRDILLDLLRQHQQLGIAEQIGYQKFYLYSIITHSTAIEGSTVTEVEAQLLFDEGITSSKRTTTEKMVDKSALMEKMVDKWSIKPSLAEKLADILEYVEDKEQFTTDKIVQHFGFNETTAKRYMRQLTEFGYLEAHGANKNRTYTKKR